MILMKKVFLDNNSSTRIDDRVLEAMIPYYTDIISPPGTDYGHSLGIKAKKAVDESRALIAGRINVNPDCLIFTSGQAESNNFVIKGLTLAKFSEYKQLSTTILASKISHSTVLNSLKASKKFGVDFKLVNVDSEGFTNIDHLKELLENNNVVLVSLPLGNVEIGTIDNIKDITSICHEHNALVHADATHSFCKIDMDVNALGIDLMTIASDYIHGPRGVGALYIREGVKIEPLIHGGFQEKGRRGGSENVPGIVGFAKATSLYDEKVVNHVRKLRDYLWDEFSKKVTNFQVTGSLNRDKRLPHHFSVVINYVEGESILLHMDMLGFMIATGSACSSRNLKASHVLTAIGLPTEISHGSVRIGLSKYNSKEEIDSFIDNLIPVIERLRQISPVDEEFMREWMKMKEQGKVGDEGLHHNHIEEEDD